MSATDNIKNLQMLLDTLSADHLGKEEFTKSFKAVVDFVKKIDSRNADEFKQIRQILSDLAQRVQEENTSLTNDLKGQVDHIFVGKKLDEMSLKNEMSIGEMKNITKTMMDEMMAKMHAEMMSIKDGHTLVKGKDFFDGKDGREIEPEEVRNKLESIKDEDEKLEIKAISHLREELDKLEKRLSSKYTGGGGGGGGGGGRIVKVYDASSQLNGVLKTFTLPAFWRVLHVELTSFPYGACRPDTDFTTDASAMTITFTAQIDASTQLAAGQSLIVEYSE